MIWYEIIRYDMIWNNTIWYDMIWYEMIWYNMKWNDMWWYVMSWYDMIWYEKYDMIWNNMWWYDIKWNDVIWYDMTWYDMTWYEMTWHDMINDPYGMFFSGEKQHVFFVRRWLVWTGDGIIYIQSLARYHRLEEYIIVKCPHFKVQNITSGLLAMVMKNMIHTMGISEKNGHMIRSDKINGG